MMSEAASQAAAQCREVPVKTRLEDVGCGLTLNAKLNYPSNAGESSAILEQENDGLEAVFLADASGACTCFEVGGEHRGDPDNNRPDV